MSILDRLVDWIIGPDDDEAPAAAAAPRKRRRPITLPDDEEEEDLLTPQVESLLTERLGAPADAWDAPEGGLVTRVLRYDAEPAHRVWVSRGLRAWRRPHELVVRLRADGEAPAWPRALLLALDARTRELDHTIALGEIVADLAVEGAPWRHFLMVPDPVLEWIEDPFAPDGGLAFVQVVPLTDAQLAEMADEAGRTALLAAWSQEDHLLLV
ncbi:MAG: hypothetical protein R3F59_09515 [Myxococcota bacterium]